MKQLFIILSFIFSISLATQAQETEQPDLVTDRPDQTESSSIIPKGAFQIESGFIFESRNAKYDDYNSWEFLGTLLRYGLWENFELRIASSFQSIDGSSTEDDIKNDYSISGMGPVDVGFKVYVVEEKGLRPEIAFLSHMTLRHLGDEKLRPTYSFPTARLAFSHTLSEKVSLGYNTGFEYNGENPDGFFVYTVAMGYSISEKVGVFGELYGNFDHGDLPNHKVDAGLTWLASPNFQLDLSGGYGIDSDVDKYFVSTGFSWRIPR